MSELTTFEDTPSVTSSPVSECGATLYDELVGGMIDPSGQAVARASRSPAPAPKRALLTSGTCGRTSSASSRSAALQSSLESRLQARLSNLGSTLYKLTWKGWVTPLQVSRSRLRASVPRTSEIDFSGWVTPTSRDFKDTPGMVAQRDGKDRVDQLPRQAYLAGWPTPNASDEKWRYSTPEAADRRRASGKQVSLECAAHFAGWPTPTATDAIKQGNVNPRPGAMGLSETVARLRENPQPARLTASGELLIGSSAGMESGGQLPFQLGLQLEVDLIVRVLLVPVQALLAAG